MATTDKPAAQTQSQGTGQSQTAKPSEPASPPHTDPKPAAAPPSSEGHLATGAPPAAPADPKSVEAGAAKPKPDNWDSFTTHEETRGSMGGRVAMPGTGGEPPAENPPGSTAKPAESAPAKP